MKHVFILAALCGLSLLVMGPVSAQSFAPLLSGTVGSGSSESYLVLDFENRTATTPDNSYAFGYLYNQPAAGSQVTGLQMIQALTSANIGLSVTTTTYSFGTAVDSFSYKGNSESSFLSNAYWNYWLSADGQKWTSSAVGVSDRNLSNGSYDGWAWNTTQTNGPTPVTPLLNPPAVPEAATPALLLLGLLSLTVFRRRTQR